MAWETRRDIREQTIEVLGRTVRFRLLTAPELLDTGMLFRVGADGSATANFRELAPIIAGAVTEIEGVDRKDIRRFLLTELVDIAALTMLVTKIIAASSLTDADAKNSDSSPVSLSGESAGGTAPTTTTGNDASVSATPTPSYTGAEAETR